jgi:hypothetical protein
MAKQEPQQPFFIPRVAGVTHPPPQSRPQPPPQLKPEVQAPAEVVFRPTVAAPPPRPLPKPEVQAPAEAVFQPSVAAPTPPPQLKLEVQAPGEAVFQPSVAAPTPPPQLKLEVQAPAEAVFQPSVAAPTPPPQLKLEVQAPGEAVFRPKVPAPTPPPQLKPEVRAPGETVFRPTVPAPTPPPQLKPEVQAPGEAVFRPTAPAPAPQLKPEAQAPDEAVSPPVVLSAPPVTMSPAAPPTVAYTPVAAPPPPQIGRTPFPVQPKRQGGKGMLISVLVALFLCTAMVVWVALTPSLRQKLQELASSRKSGSTVEVADSPPSNSTPQSPPVYPEGASRVEDKEIGFSFAVPDGYLAASQKAPDAQYHFERKLFTEAKRTILIRKVNGEYPGGTGTAADLPALLDGHAVSTVTFNWRGRELSGSRSLEPNLAKPFVVFSAVIPLREQRILLEVGGSEESEAVIREVMDQVLGSLSEQ